MTLKGLTCVQVVEWEEEDEDKWLGKDSVETLDEECPVSRMEPIE
jgi:hypothetical protein